MTFCVMSSGQNKFCLFGLPQLAWVCIFKVSAIDKLYLVILQYFFYCLFMAKNIQWIIELQKTRATSNSKLWRCCACSTAEHQSYERSYSSLLFIYTRCLLCLLAILMVFLNLRKNTYLLIVEHCVQ